MAEIKNNINIDFTEVDSSESSQYAAQTEVVKVQSAKRHAIKINDINVFRNKYDINNVITSNNLVSVPSRSIAIFCNEYIPKHFNSGEYIKYIMKINGKDYEMVPINSDKNGIKIIKTSDYDFNSDYVEYIEEKITSAYLTIKITCPNEYETPYISDLKILVGDKNV